MRLFLIWTFSFSISLAASIDRCFPFYVSRKEHMMSPDTSSKTIERRPKTLTTGLRKDATPDMDPRDVRIDTADPSLVMPITYPDGTTKFRINFSGHRYIEVDQPSDFYRGGVFKVKRSRGFYADGTEMIGPYHNASWPWDVVIYKNDAGENIAFGGVMVQAERGKLPSVAEHNRTRSRWWGKVKQVKTATGDYEDHIIWQGPLHDFNTTPPHATWVYHGYGGTLLTRFNAEKGFHEPIKNERGNYTLFYERVTEEKVDESGIARPWVTTMFARDIDPSLKFTVGPEVMVTDIRSAQTGEYFSATRRGMGEHVEGYLAEGGNVLIDKNKGTLIKAWSGNDYVGRYGIYLDYLPAGEKIDRPFIPLMDKKGEAIDFATKLELRKLLNATWLGRPQLEYDPTGKLWLRFHFVDIDTVPEGEPVQGWPSAGKFPEFARTSMQFPVKLGYDSAGRPVLKTDIKNKFKAMYK